MIDTHTHLYMVDSYPDGGSDAVRRGVDAGVEMMVLPGVDRESVAPMLELYTRHPDNTALAVGLHPTEVGPDWREELRDILALTADVEAVGIGETGVDLHWDKQFLPQQLEAFGEQVQIALDRDLPVVIHSRDAVDETVEVLKQFYSKMPTLVFHSFTAGVREMDSLRNVAPDAIFGINGVLTFKNATPLREAVSHLEPEFIVTETDAPFLAPVPFRGQTNESAYIPHIVKAIGEIKGMATDEIAAVTTANAYKLYPRLRKTS